MLEISFEDYSKNGVLVEVKAAFFDFDGVIVDSTKLKFDSFVDSAETLKGGSGQFLGAALHNELSGVERKEVAKWVVKKFGIPPDVFLEKFKCLLIERESLNQPNASVIRSIMDLNRERMPMAIVSAAPSEAIVETLAKFQLPLNLFSLGVFGSNFGKKENVISDLLEKSKIPAANALYFGDMPTDRAVARTLKINFVQVQSWAGQHANWE